MMNGFSIQMSIGTLDKKRGIVAVIGVLEYFMQKRVKIVSIVTSNKIIVKNGLNNLFDRKSIAYPYGQYAIFSWIILLYHNKEKKWGSSSNTCFSFSPFILLYSEIIVLYRTLTFDVDLT